MMRIDGEGKDDDDFSKHTVKIRYNDKTYIFAPAESLMTLHTRKKLRVQLLHSRIHRNPLELNVRPQGHMLSYT